MPGLMGLLQRWVEKNAQAPGRPAPPAPHRRTAPATGAAGATPVAPAAEENPPPAWWRALPGDLVFLDVETTGFAPYDRIVSLAAIRLAKEGLRRGDLSLRWLHLVFDPLRRSHPAAERVHGLDDWMLRHQPTFAEHAGEIRDLLDGAAMLVAHNSGFDTRFLAREFVEAGVEPRRGLLDYCTMEAWRDRHPGTPAGLRAVAESVGQVPASVRHGALEDAWFCMAAFLRLETPLRLGALAASLPDREFTNLRPVPPRPEGPLPRRRNKAKAAQSAAGRPATAAEASSSSEAVA